MRKRWLTAISIWTLIAGLAFVTSAARTRLGVSADVSGYRSPATLAAAKGALDNSALKETLIDLEKQSWEAWKKRDGKFFQEFLSDDHVEVGFNGTATKPQIVAFVAGPICTVKSYSVDRFNLTVFDAKTALLTYHAAQDTTCNGAAVLSPVWVSSLFIKRGNRWLNSFYQQTQTSK
jgi:hypothetical protein